MEIISTAMPEVKIIKPKLFSDQRGYFSELYQLNRYAEELGVKDGFVQDNLSRSFKGVLRGLHYQCPNPQGKLVTVLRGSVYDVVVDLRQGSPTFLQWLGVELSDENNYQLWIPPGFAHGFLTLSEVADFFYKCTAYYDINAEKCLMWNDPALGISWPSMPEFLLSMKDQQGKTLDELKKDSLFIYV